MNPPAKTSPALHSHTVPQGGLGSHSPPSVHPRSLGDPRSLGARPAPLRRRLRIGIAVESAARRATSSLLAPTLRPLSAGRCRYSCSVPLPRPCAMDGGRPAGRRGSSFGGPRRGTDPEGGERSAWKGLCGPSGVQPHARLAQFAGRPCTVPAPPAQGQRLGFPTRWHRVAPGGI